MKTYVPRSTVFGFPKTNVVPTVTFIFVYDSNLLWRKVCQIKENILNILFSLKFISCCINNLKHLAAKAACHATCSLLFVFINRSIIDFEIFTRIKRPNHCVLAFESPCYFAGKGVNLIAYENCHMCFRCKH